MLVKSLTWRYVGLEKMVHLPDAHKFKSVHPAAKICTPGAGCTLNFEHWGHNGLTKCSTHACWNLHNQLSAVFHHGTINRFCNMVT